MPSKDRRAIARRRAWGRGPMILRFEPLEGRHLLSTVSTALPDLVATGFNTPGQADWGDSLNSTGVVLNRGKGPTTHDVTVGLYASTTSSIGPGSVAIGSVTIPAGLGAGQSFFFAQPVSLPLAPISGVGARTGNAFWVALRVDTTQAQPETDKLNNEGRGRNIDASIVTVTPPAPSSLSGTSFAVTPQPTTWGSTVYVTAQVRNNAQGNAPATRARLVLTPAGIVPGGGADITIGDFTVPPIPAWQTANVTQSIQLPAGPASSLASTTNYVLSMVEDADFLTNPMTNRPGNAGIGIDQATITINPNTAGYTPPKQLPDLAPASVVVPTTNLYWGTTFQAQANIQNLGQVDASNFRVRFLLTGSNGATNQAVVLGDAIIPGLKAGYSQNIVQTLKLPNRLPYGTNLSSLAYGRIVVVVDPEQSIDESVRSNNLAASSPVILRVLGSDGTTTVPTGPPISYAPPTTTATAATTTTAGTVKVTTHVVTRRAHYQKVVPKKPAVNPIIHQLDQYQRKVTKAFKDLSKF